MRTTQDEGEIKRYQSIEKRRQRLFVVLCFRCVAIIEEDVCVCVRARVRVPVMERHKARDKHKQRREAGDTKNR